MDVLNIDKCKKEIFTIREINNKYILKYDNKGFLIEPEIAFKGCSIYTNITPNKVKIPIDICEDCDKFEKDIKYLVDTISEIVEYEDNIDIGKVMNPIYEKENKKMLFAIINTNTIIIDSLTKEKIDINELYKKKFNIYPIFYGPSFNIYINFVLHTILIKELKEEWNNKITINYKKVNKAMDKIS